MRFALLAILIAGILYGIGYYPSLLWDKPDGPTGLGFGLALAFLLIVPGFLVLNWALGKSQKVFLIAFGVSFLIRLIILITLFIVYIKLVNLGNVSFTLSTGVGYGTMLCLEILSFKGVLVQNIPPDPKEKDSSEEG